MATARKSALQCVLRRIAILPTPTQRLRSFWLCLRGAKIGRGTQIPPRTLFTWPHQVSFGENCILQTDIFFNYDHYWTPGPSIIFGDRVFIGKGCEFNIRQGLFVDANSLIASGVKMIDHDHGMDSRKPIRDQDCLSFSIHVDADVWIGANAIVLKGVRIGRGAVVAAGAVVTRSVPEMEIWGGVPARKLSIRATTTRGSQNED